MGPFVSDLLTIAELTDFWNQTPEEYEESKGLVMDTSSEEWQYQVARIFNIQLARTRWHTLPAFLDGSLPKMLRIETGAFHPRWIHKWRKEEATPAAREFLGIPEKKRKGKARSQEEILRALDAFN